MPSSAKQIRSLVDVAMGRAHADLVIRKGQWVCVQSGEIIDGTDVAIVDGRIAFVGENASHTVGSDTIVIDARGRYLVPGLLDGHMHVESGMVTVTEFVRAVAPRGLRLVATAARGGVSYRVFDWQRRPLALCIGSEGAGLPEPIAAACAEKVTIPMQGQAESLNAAVAASILLFAAVA